MGIFDRIKTIFKAEANAAIDKMEDPEKILNQSIRDMTEKLNEAKAQVAESIAYEKRLKMQYDKALEKAKEWENKAMMAVNANRDDLAAEALGRQAEAQREADGFREQWQAQKQGCDNIKAKLKQMNDKIEEAKRKKALLVAKAKRAEANKTIHNTLAGISDDGAFAAFDRMAEKVETLEAESQAAEELVVDFEAGDSLEREINSLKASPSNNDALAALKAKMGKGPAVAPAEPSYDSQYGSVGGKSISNINSWDDL